MPTFAISVSLFLSPLPLCLDALWASSWQAHLWLGQRGVLTYFGISPIHITLSIWAPFPPFSPLNAHISLNESWDTLLPHVCLQ